MRILVVEDDRKVATFIRRGLEEEGYAVDVLHDGTAAGEQAHCIDTTPRFSISSCQGGQGSRCFAISEPGRRSCRC
jgi:DNA-binding NtrC family response regulator